MCWFFFQLCMCVCVCFVHLQTGNTDGKATWTSAAARGPEPAAQGWSCSVDVSRAAKRGRCSQGQKKNCCSHILERRSLCFCCWCCCSSSFFSFLFFVGQRNYCQADTGSRVEQSKIERENPFLPAGVSLIIFYSFWSSFLILWINIILFFFLFFLSKSNCCQARKRKWKSWPACWQSECWRKSAIHTIPPFVYFGFYSIFPFPRNENLVRELTRKNDEASRTVEAIKAELEDKRKALESNENGMRRKEKRRKKKKKKKEEQQKELKKKRSVTF